MPASTTRGRVRQCLGTVDFPANKNRLLAAAARNGCDDDTARALGAIPPETYANLGEVLSSVRLTEDDELSEADKDVAHRIHHNKPRLAQTAKNIPPSPIAEALGENPGS